MLSCHGMSCNFMVIQSLFLKSLQTFKPFRADAQAQAWNQAWPGPRSSSPGLGPSKSFQSFKSLKSFKGLKNAKRPEGRFSKLLKLFELLSFFKLSGLRLKPESSARQAAKDCKRALLPELVTNRCSLQGFVRMSTAIVFQRLAFRSISTRAQNNGV